jgi:chromosome segregation ATPase
MAKKKKNQIIAELQNELRELKRQNRLLGEMNDDIMSEDKDLREKNVAVNEAKNRFKVRNEQLKEEVEDLKKKLAEQAQNHVAAVSNFNKAKDADLAKIAKLEAQLEVLTQIVIKSIKTK